MNKHYLYFYTLAISTILGLVSVSCGNTKQDDARVVSAVASLQSIRWNTYLQDPIFERFTIEQIVYYAECEAYRFGIVRHEHPVSISLSPEGIGKIALHEAIQQASTVTITVKLNAHKKVITLVAAKK
jgi:hypothetical protein